ncbi:MAG: hypothetical protein IIZ12_07105 [Eggerthellaceae bacterium]|nr:hypothetical protein [Eggerthellaceae bacterium]
MCKNSRPIAFPPIYGIDATNRYPNIRISIETITPEIAEKMLQANVGNRDPKREAIAKAIQKGEWTLNGATIVFDENGNLTDGQNRLRACIAANKPIDTIVVRGVPRAAQITMDVGVKRQLVDYLKMAGYKNCSTVGKVGMMLYRADSYGLEGSFTLPTIGKDTIKTLFEYINENYDKRIEPLVSPCRCVQRLYPGIMSGTIGVLFDIFRLAGEDNFTVFVQQLTNKRPACMSVRLLQNQLRKNSDSKQGKMPQRMIAALIIKTWNAYMRGDDIKTLRFTQGGAHPENFPEIFLGYE